MCQVWSSRADLRFGRRTYGLLRGLSLPLAGLALMTLACGHAAEAKPMRIIAFGDSLTAGYLLPQADSFAAKLEAALRKRGHDVTVVNAGISGDTTTGGLSRLDWTMADGGDIVILELGANDMLRGLDPSIARRNLAKMLEKLKAKKSKVLLAGMRASPSMGKEYGAKFDVIYPELAKQYDVSLYPFFLDGIMGDAGQHLPDGLHPNAKGVDTMVAHILPSVEALLKQAETRS